MRGMRTPGFLVLVPVLASILATGCGLTGAPAVAARGTTSGVGPFTLVTGRDTTGYLRSLLGRWNGIHPDERATLIELPEAADDQRAQMVANLQAQSDRYDVLNLDVVWTAEFAEAGWIVPLDPRQFPLARFLSPVVNTAMYRGTLYAVPYTSNAGLLYYRSDILRRAGVQPPRTWAQLRDEARQVAPRYGLAGYAGQFLPYEGLTVNVAEAVQSAGGDILTDDGTKVAIDTPQARQALSFLVSGVRQGWIPKASLAYKEEESRRAFESGRLLFLRNWPYVYGVASRVGSPIRGRFGVVPLPGPHGVGSSSLGGGNLAISAYSRHQRSALAFIKYFTGLDNERQVLIQGSLPPVWAQLYDDPALIRRYPYLPVLKQSILRARPRPQSPVYNQVSLAISNEVYQALTSRKSVDAAITGLAADLSDIVSNR